jgi:hypothetical protein
MTAYKDFDQILNADVVDEKERIKFTQRWVADSYKIPSSMNPDWVAVLSSVHDHDNLPKHFGEVKVGSAFMVLSTQLIRLPDGWHIGVGQSDGNFIPVHPSYETSWNHPLNRKEIQKLTQAVRTGKVLNLASNNQPQPSGPTIIVPETAYQSDEPEVSQDQITPTTQIKTSSVSIDLSNW